MQNGVAFSDQTIRVEIDDNGIVHMEIPSGDSLIQMAFPISQLIANIGVCQKALADWQKRSRRTSIIPFRSDLLGQSNH